MQNPLPFLLPALAAFLFLALAMPTAAQDGQPMVPLIMPRLERKDPHQTMREAHVAEQRGDTDTAWALVTSAINSGDLDQRALADAYIWRGRLTLDGGDPSQALADFRRAVELAPQTSPALAWRALAWLALGRSETALADARQATHLTPERTEAHLALGLALLALNQPEQALTSLGQALCLSPKNTPALLARAKALQALNISTQPPASPCSEDAQPKQ